MFDVAASLQTGLDAAQSRLQSAQSALAQANLGRGGRSADAAMAKMAQAAIFNQELLNAIHARFAEIKAAAK